jgi:hypothetical protein
MLHTARREHGRGMSPARDPCRGLTGSLQIHHTTKGRYVYGKGKEGAGGGIP